MVELEREAFLASHLSKALEGLPQNPEVWKAAVFDLPAEMTDDQLAAWLELADFVTDSGFLDKLRQQGQWFTKLKGIEPSAWTQLFEQVLTRAQKLSETNPPNSQVAQGVIQDWLEALEVALNHNQSPASWLLHHFESSSDVRFERYWQLMAIIKKLPPLNSRNEALKWVLEALRWRVEQEAKQSA